MSIKDWFKRSDPITNAEATAAFVRPEVKYAPDAAVLDKVIQAAYSMIRKVMHRQHIAEVIYERFECVEDEDDGPHELHQRATALGTAAAVHLNLAGSFRCEVVNRTVPPADDEDEDSDMVEYVLVITWGPQA